MKIISDILLLFPIMFLFADKLHPEEEKYWFYLFCMYLAGYLIKLDIWKTDK